MENSSQDIVVERYKNPRYRGSLEPSDLDFDDDNPLCGDHIRISLRISSSGEVIDARFDGEGCAVSQAAADLLMEAIIGKTIDELRGLGKLDVLQMLKLDNSSSRAKCAILPLKVMRECLYGAEDDVPE